MSKKIYQCNRQQNVLWLRAAVAQSIQAPIVIRLLVDTGASYTVIPTKILERIGCNLNSAQQYKKIVTANGAIDVPIVIIPWFNCLGIKIENYPVVALDLPVNSFTDGLLGMDFLREVGAVIDTAKAQIIVKSE